MDVPKLIGTSAALIQCLDQVDAVATTDATVLIEGESGSGKELLAHRVHRHSARRDGPLVAVNCAAVPRDLFESEFFGHIKGAFTGASRDRSGRFEAAHEGTLFLDEVGEIPPEHQGKLLRALQDGTFERVGDDKTRRVDVRIVAATNRRLGTEVEEERFRRDLFYRLSAFTIEVPPLRHRVGDIPDLAKQFIANLCSRYDLPVPELTPAAVALLTAYDWPGNIRELKNVLERALILGKRTSTLDVARALVHAPPKPTAVPDDNQRVAQDGTARTYLNHAELQDIERDNLIAILESARWKISGPNGAASLYGIKPTTFSSKLASFNIRRPDPQSLYVKLGGAQRIAAFARELLGRLQSDPQLGRFWRHRSNSGIAREERLLAQYLCAAFGGPQTYRGATMVQSHKTLGITQADWKTFTQHLERTIELFGIPHADRAKIFAMTEALNEEIVTL